VLDGLIGPVRDWREKVAALVRFYQTAAAREDPYVVYDVHPSSHGAWPPALPPSRSLQSFYALCNGGDFGPMVHFAPLERLQEETDRWIDVLKDYDARGDILSSDRHVVFANDADGTPWILDAPTDRVASFYWKGGDWQEPRFPSFDAFMSDLFTSRLDDGSWATVVERVLGP